MSNITPFQADYNRYWEGLRTIEMIEEVQMWLGITAGDYDRYSKANIVRALNLGGVRFAKLTKCLMMPVVIVLKGGRQNYRLPYNVCRVVSGRYYWSASRDAYDELQIITDQKAMQRKDSTFRGTTGTPDHMFPSYVSGNVANIAIAPYPAEGDDGDSWDGETQGVVTSATGFDFVGNILGKHGYPGNSAFLLDSEGRDLSTLGAKTGFPVFNTTKEKYAVITGVVNGSATNDKITGTLTDGADWDAGDSYLIPMSEYGVVLDASMSEAYTMTSYLGVIGDIYGMAGNLVLDVARNPLPLNTILDDMVSELPANDHVAQVGYAVYWLGKSAHKGVTQADKAAEGLNLFNQHLAEYGLPDMQQEKTDDEIEDRLGW